MPYSVRSAWRKSEVKWTVWWYLSREIQFDEKAIHLGVLWAEYWRGPILKHQKKHEADSGWLLRAGAWFQASTETAHLLISDVLGGHPHNLSLQHFKNWTVWTQNVPHFTSLIFLIEIKVDAFTVGVEWWCGLQVGQWWEAAAPKQQQNFRKEEQIYHVNRK